MILAAWTRLHGGPADADDAPFPVPPVPAASIPSFLTAAEAARAAGLQRPERKDQYLAGHGLLRLLAGALLRLDPERLGLPAEGRPFLEDPPKPVWLSLAHSGPFVVAAASDEGPIGVDVERWDQERDWAGLAAGMGWSVSPSGLPASEKRGFLETWTIREAEFKAGLAEGAGFVRRAEGTGSGFVLALVSATDTGPEWLGPGNPGPTRILPTRPPRP